MNILLITSAQNNSNTDRLNKEFISIVGKENIKIINANTINHCIGCRLCIDKGKCVKYNDDLTHFLSQKYPIIIFSGAIYGFTFNSALMTAFHRMLFGLENKILGFILCSGSSGYYGGVDLIESTLKRLNEYCGFIIAPIFNKVTYDKRTPVNDCDILGLKKLFNDVEEIYNEISKN